MRTAIAALLGMVMVTSAHVTPPPGDSVYGRVTAVRRADLVVFNHAAGDYTLRLVGVAVPTATRAADTAAAFVRNMVLNRPARMRLEGRDRNGVLRARLYTAGADAGIREVNVELVRAGLARKVANFDFKYGELANAEREARAARRGVFAAPR